MKHVNGEQEVSSLRVFGSGEGAERMPGLN